MNCFPSASADLTILLQVFPKRDDTHSVILVCVVTLVNMNDL